MGVCVARPNVAPEGATDIFSQSDLQEAFQQQQQCDDGGAGDHSSVFAIIPATRELDLVPPSTSSTSSTFTTTRGYHPHHHPRNDTTATIEVEAIGETGEMNVSFPPSNHRGWRHDAAVEEAANRDEDSTMMVVENCDDGDDDQERVDYLCGSTSQKRFSTADGTQHNDSRTSSTRPFPMAYNNSDRNTFISEAASKGSFRSSRYASGMDDCSVWSTSGIGDIGNMPPLDVLPLPRFRSV